MMITINYNNIVDNMRYLENKFNKKAFFVVKNDAYNTDVIETVRQCTNAGFSHFALTDIYEAIKIRNNKIDAYILVMNPTSLEEIKLAKSHDIALSITSYEWYKQFEEQLVGVKLHLKINIGMNRFGLNDIVQINELLSNNSNIEGIFTHFPCSDLEDLTRHHQQVDSFVNIFNSLIHTNNIKYIHSENSAALFLDDKRLSFCNYARYGIIGYGYSPIDVDTDLKPCMYVKAQVVALRQVAKDECIGYGQNLKANKNISIAILNCGYGDGLSKLRINLPVTIKNKEYKILAISMSHLIIEVDEAVIINDWVELYGDKHRIDDLLKVCDTTNSIHMTSLQR